MLRGDMTLGIACSSTRAILISRLHGLRKLLMDEIPYHSNLFPPSLSLSEEGKQAVSKAHEHAAMAENKAARGTDPPGWRLVAVLRHLI